MEFRKERDALGEVSVPKDVYFGSFTVRALGNFDLSGQRAPREFIFALGLIKRAIAETNIKFGLLDKKIGKAISQASKEFADGKFDKEFPLDIFQAGAGTPFNMNANEIIANRANEILGGKKGKYDPVHPNDHVNMGQSSNDVIPTAVRLTALFLFDPLAQELDGLVRALKEKGKIWKHIVKVGRTHLEDAVPVTLGQEFEAYGHMLQKTLDNLIKTREGLLELGIGGTALGTGINSHPRLHQEVVKTLSSFTGYKLKPSDDLVEMTMNMGMFSTFSAGLRETAVALIKIIQDLKLLNMGPNAGIGEITLPEAEPGSSIMPGKVNPSIAEAAHMTCVQVLGNDHAVSICAQVGQLELNVMTPAILFNISFSLKLLANTVRTLREKCIEGIVANEEHIQHIFEGSLVTATALSPYLGYHRTAEIVNEALKQKKTIRATVLEKGWIEEKDLDRILSPERLTKPSLVDNTLVKKIRRALST